MDEMTPNIGAAYEITIFDVDGNVKQVIREEAKCFVMNFLRMVKNWLSNSTYASYADTSVSTNFRRASDGSIVAGVGVQGSRPAVPGSFLANAGVGDVTKGIVVGTSNTPVQYDDYKLGSIIAHGAGAGQIVYDGVASFVMSTVGNAVTISIPRMVNNGNSSAITVNEIGLYAQGRSSLTIMLLRDVISPVTLGPGETALIVYKLIFNEGE